MPVWKREEIQAVSWEARKGLRVRHPADFEGLTGCRDCQSNRGFLAPEDDDMKHDYAAACRFFSAEDACRFALAAYYAAAREIEPPKGEPWMLEGAPYASAGDFADAFMDQVRDRVAAAAVTASVRRSGSTCFPLWWPNPEEPTADLSETGQVLLHRLMKHLPPLDNTGNNQQARGLING